MPRLDQWVMYTSIAVMFLTVLIPTAIGPDPTPKPVTSSPSSEPYAAIVLGSTGAVGRQLVRELASSYLCSRVGIVVRASQQWSAMEQSAKMIRKHFRLSPEQAEKITVISVPFEVLETESFMDVYRDKFKGYQKGFSAMGTTMAKAGSAAAFRAVDYNATLAAVTLMRLGGVSHFNLVSTIGADASSLFTYPQVKGEIEHAVSRLGFSRVSIHRPGVLLTRRLGESRPVEQIAQALLPRFHWLLSFLGTMGERWKAVQVETVAEFVRQAAESQPTALAQKHEYGAKELALCTAYAAEESKGGRELKSLLPSVGRATTQVEIFENEIIRGRKI